MPDLFSIDDALHTERRAAANYDHLLTLVIARGRWPWDRWSARVDRWRLRRRYPRESQRRWAARQRARRAS